MTATRTSTSAAAARGDRPALGVVRTETGGWSACVWAPRLSHPTLHLHTGSQPIEVAMVAGEDGCWHAQLPMLPENTTYWIVDDDGRRFFDPASRSQPDGVHGPSALVDLSQPRVEPKAWAGRPLDTYAIYELHVGTFTPRGTLDAAIEHLPRLAELGITAVELMPVAEFPGRRNWGYDGVALFAVHHAYGGPRALQRFVDAAHRADLAVVLDVVYNHLGPEGNHLAELGPYFTDAYRTPWGPAVNLDGPHCAEVRRFFIDNALMWLRDFDIDALRLDAVHALIDRSPRPFLAELSQRVATLSEHSWRRFLIAESDANDPRLFGAIDRFGLGMDGVWADDFHHAVHAFLTGERRGYYEDYGDARHILLAEQRGFGYAGEYSRFRRRPHGAPADGVEPQRFVACIQNHDQIGNRARGDRLTTLVERDACDLAAALLLTSVHTPLLFMGQEWGETAAFAYFTDHGDPELVEAVRKGRKAEFVAHGWEQEALDPQDPATFEMSKIDRGLLEKPEHRATLELYRALLAMRQTPQFRAGRSQPAYESLHEGTVLIYRLGRPVQLLAVFNLSDRDHAVPVDPRDRGMSPLVDSGDPRFGGRGPTASPIARGEAIELRLPARGFVIFVTAAEGAR